MVVAHLFGRLVWITKPCLTIERYALKDGLSGGIPSLNGPESRVLSKPRPILARPPLQQAMRRVQKRMHHYVHNIR